MIRVNVVAEGKTEMKFAKELLNQFFDGKPIIDARGVLSSRNNKTNYEYRGGMTTYCPHFSAWIEKLKKLVQAG